MNQIGAIAKSLLKVFVGSILSGLIVFGTGIFDLGKSDWKGIAAAAVAAVLVAGYSFLDPSDTRFGINKEQ